MERSVSAVSSAFTSRSFLDVADAADTVFIPQLLLFCRYYWTTVTHVLFLLYIHLRALVTIYYYIADHSPHVPTRNPPSRSLVEDLAQEGMIYSYRRRLEDAAP